MSEEKIDKVVITEEALAVVIVQIRQFAEKLHIWYEEAAKEVGWETQESCQVPFDQLPEKNQEVMMRVAVKAFNWKFGKKEANVKTAPDGHQWVLRPTSRVFDINQAPLVINQTQPPDPNQINC